MIIMIDGWTPQPDAGPSLTLGTRYAMRRNYRLKVGIPLDAPLYQSDKPQWRRTWVA